VKQLVSLGLFAVMLSASVDNVARIGAESLEKSRLSQERVNQRSDKASEAFERYLEVQREIKVVRAYNAQLKEVIASQKGEEASLNDQIISIDLTQQQIMPLLSDMVKTYARFVKEDTPFLYEERMERAKRLQGVLHRSDVTISEKYRQVLEAYTIEMEYARTIEAYRGELAEAKTTVDFLRIGRVGLFYRSLDGERCGRYNPESKRFETLDASYADSIRDGLRVAKKSRAPKLLALPFDGPKGGAQ